MRKHNLMLTSGLVLAAACLSLAGCNKQSGSQDSSASSLPLAEGAPPPATYADQLPSAGPVTVNSASYGVERYRYIDDAYDMGDAFGDSPPDYAIDYQGERPWVWRSGSGAYRVVEQGPDGERDYYYAAGADQPFLIRDPRYAYAFDGGQLV